MKSINLNKIKDKVLKFISTQESLKDIEPIQWSKDVLSGKKKVVVYNSNTKKEGIYMNENIMNKTGFKKEVELVKNNICPFCNTQIRLEDFRGAISLKEFTISGLCQDCQNDLFD